jgi:hypothetical protein
MVMVVVVVVEVAMINHLQIFLLKEERQDTSINGFENVGFLQNSIFHGVCVFCNNFEHQ